MLNEAMAGLTIVGIALNPIQARVKGITRLLFQCSWLTKFSKNLLFINLLLRQSDWQLVLPCPMCMCQLLQTVKFNVFYVNKVHTFFLKHGCLIYICSKMNCLIYKCFILNRQAIKQISIRFNQAKSGGTEDTFRSITTKDQLVELSDSVQGII